MSKTVESEIHAYIRRRLDEKADTTAIADELKEKFPVRVNDSSVAMSFIALAQTAIKPTPSPKLYEVTCPQCQGMPNLKPHCPVCFGDGTVLVSVVNKERLQK
jgi:hypothetical protein